MSDSPLLPVRIAQTAALTTVAIAAGANLGFSFYLIPRLLESPTPLMLKQWNTSFELGKTTIPPLAGIGSALFFYLSYTFSQTASHTQSWKMYLLSGVLAVGFVPYTLLVIEPTNRKLKAKVEETKGLKVTDKLVEVGVAGGETAHVLVNRWGVLNLGRGALLVASAVVGVWTALG